MTPFIAPAPFRRRGQPLGRKNIQFVRFAILAAVLAFGAVAFFVSRSGGVARPPETSIAAFRIVFYGLAGVSVVATLVMRSRLPEVTDAMRRRSMCVVGYALGESPALFGGVLWILTGTPIYYLVGLALVLLAIFLLSPETDEVMSNAPGQPRA